MVILAGVGVILYSLAVIRYLTLGRQRPGTMLLRMAVAFVIVAWSAQRQWYEERFSDLYLDETAAGAREITVLFADLQDFTSFSERHKPGKVSEMLNAYFEVAIPPVVRRHGGDVDRIIGDALMVTFNRRGDQPDHAERGARAALALQEATAAIAAEHPEWPRFRVGVDTGEAIVGILGTSGGRTHTAISDTVNLASRLEGQAPAGGVALGPGTVERLPGARTELLGSITVKGRAEPLEVHRLVRLSGSGDESAPGLAPGR